MKNTSDYSMLPWNLPMVDHHRTTKHIDVLYRNLYDSLDELWEMVEELEWATSDLLSDASKRNPPEAGMAAPVPVR